MTGSVDILRTRSRCPLPHHRLESPHSKGAEDDRTALTLGRFLRNESGDTGGMV